MADPLPHAAARLGEAEAVDAVPAPPADDATPVPSDAAATVPADTVAPTDPEATLDDESDPEDDLPEDSAGPDLVDAAPTVICDNVHVVYRIAGRNRASNPATALRKVITRRGDRTVFKRVHAIRGVSFVAREGDAIALIGSNGSGKSTLLRAIAGLLPTESGNIYTAGRPALLGVNAALMKELSGEENILLGCMAMGMSRAEARARRDWIARFADLGDFLSLPMNAYSSGMAARLRFAIAASASHEILMIDEALATGDAEFRRRSEQRILKLREEAGTVFLVSHSLSVVRLTCNRAIWLEKGKIVMDGEANEVVDAYESVYDPEVEKLERKRHRAKKRRDRQATQDASRRAAAAARAAREARASSEAESAEDRADQEGHRGVAEPSS